MVKCLYEGVVEFLDRNNKDNFYVSIRHRVDGCFGYFLNSFLM